MSNSLFFTDEDNTGGQLYEVVDGEVFMRASIYKEATSLLVCQNGNDIFITNKNLNSVTLIRRDTWVSTTFSVGKFPYGLCEDVNGNIYVTNYGDGSLSLINYNERTKTYTVDRSPIYVGKGPKGIVADSNNNIWVACYLENVVCKVINKTVVDRINMGSGDLSADGRYASNASGPEGITCDISGNIWVACSGSNEVYKIVKGKKTNSIRLGSGKCPVAIVADTKGIVYVANFLDDSVSLISEYSGNITDNDYANLNAKYGANNVKKDGNILIITIPVGDGPTGIGIDGSNNIYVNNSLTGGTIKKLNAGEKEFKIVQSIKVGLNPYAFGDFTGWATYNAFNPRSARIAENASAGVSNNFDAYVDSIRPTFYIKDIQETVNSTRIEIGASNVDLDAFSSLTLNGQTCDTENDETGLTEEEKNLKVNKKYVFTLTEPAKYLILKGTYSVANTNPIYFNPILFSDVFQVRFGLTDGNYENFKEICYATIDFSKSPICPITINLGNNSGRFVIMIPNRIYNQIKDNTTMEQEYNYGNTWLPNDPNDSNLVKIKEGIDTFNGSAVADTFTILYYNGENFENVMHKINYFNFMKPNVKYAEQQEEGQTDPDEQNPNQGGN